MRRLWPRRPVPAEGLQPDGGDFHRWGGNPFQYVFLQSSTAVQRHGFACGHRTDRSDHLLPGFHRNGLLLLPCRLQGVQEQLRSRDLRFKEAGEVWWTLAPVVVGIGWRWLIGNWKFIPVITI